MANWTHIARPYAKAVFELALETKALADWSTWLAALKAVTSADEFVAFIENPETTAEQHVAVVCEVMNALSTFKKELPEVFKSCIQVLAMNKRLPVVPDICQQFEVLRAEEEGRVGVVVRTFMPLCAAQKQQLTERLEKRLQKTVELEELVDSSLLGGAIISVPKNDWVIDASAIGQLKKLSASLLAL